MSDYLPILVQLGLAAGVACLVVGASQFFGQRRQKHTAITDTPYECGVRAEELPAMRFAVKFYVVAILFLLMDIEVIFLIPWVVVYRDFLAQNLPVVAPVLVFLGVLIVGLVYEIRKGALDWKR